MASLPEDLPPKWQKNMQERRACLFHFECDEPISRRRARAIAKKLLTEHGEGEWEYDIVRLDEGGRDWEFRYRPHRPRARRRRR